MNRIILLDSSPLGALCNPKASAYSNDVKNWFRKRVADRDTFYIADIADYEVRRELIRSSKTASITRLNGLRARIKHIPIDSLQLAEAAQLWADVRLLGHPAAADPALDGDMILIAQSRALARQLNGNVTIATTNVAHLELFADVKEWQNIA